MHVCQVKSLTSPMCACFSFPRLRHAKIPVSSSINRQVQGGHLIYTPALITSVSCGRLWWTLCLHPNIACALTQLTLLDSSTHMNSRRHPGATTPFSRPGGPASVTLYLEWSVVVRPCLSPTAFQWCIHMFFSCRLLFGYLRTTSPILLDSLLGVGQV